MSDARSSRGLIFLVGIFVSVGGCGNEDNACTTAGAIRIEGECFCPPGTTLDKAVGCVCPTGMRLNPKPASPLATWCATDGVDDVDGGAWHTDNEEPAPAGGRGQDARRGDSSAESQTTSDAAAINELTEANGTDADGSDDADGKLDASSNGVGSNRDAGSKDASASTDPCMKKPCLHDGVCSAVGATPTCDCSSSGYAGTLCEIDPCASFVCSEALTCARRAGKASCVAACSLGAGCKPGDRCSVDSECQSSGDETARCDTAVGKCVGECPGTSTQDQAGIDELHFCSAFASDTTFNLAGGECWKVDLPYLERVDGAMLISGGGGTPPPPKVCASLALPMLTTVSRRLSFWTLKAGAIDLPKLATVGRELEFSYVDMTSVNLPMLKRAGSLELTSSNTRTLSAPLLTELTNTSPNIRTFGMFENPDLSQVNMPLLRPFMGIAEAWSLCDLPYSTAQPLIQLASPGPYNQFSNIGCCTSSTFQCNGRCQCP
jgi:EGF-like domain